MKSEAFPIATPEAEIDQRLHQEIENLAMNGKVRVEKLGDGSIKIWSIEENPRLLAFYDVSAIESFNGKKGEIFSLTQKTQEEGH